MGNVYNISEVALRNVGEVQEVCGHIEMRVHYDFVVSTVIGTDCNLLPSDHLAKFRKSRKVLSICNTPEKFRSLVGAGLG